MDHEATVSERNCACWNCSWGRCHRCGAEVTLPIYRGPEGAKTLAGYRYDALCGRRELCRERQVARDEDGEIRGVRFVVTLASYCEGHIGTNGIDKEVA